MAVSGGFSVGANCVRAIRPVYCIQSVTRLPALSTSFCRALFDALDVEPGRAGPAGSRARGLHSDIDDSPLLDLGQPFLHARLVLLAVQDVADLAARLSQPIAGERLFGVEAKQVVADLGPKRPGELAGLKFENGCFDVGGQFSP